MRKIKGLNVMLVLTSFFTASELLAESFCLDYELQMFVQESVKQDPGFTKELQTYLKAKYNRVSTQAIAAWTVGGNTSLNHIESFGENVFQPERIDAFGYELSLQKLFLATGTRISLGHTQQQSRYQYSSQLNLFGSGVVDTADTVNEQDISVTLVQPLLKNSFGLAERFPLQASELQYQAAKTDVEEAWENRLVELYGAYLDWAAGYESVRALRVQRDELEKVVVLVEKKYAARVIEKTDLLRVKENRLLVQNQLVQAENTLDSTAAVAGYLRTGKMVSQADLYTLAPKLHSSLQECEAEFIRPVPETKELRLVRRLEFIRQQLAIQTEVAENARLPQLDFVGTVRTKGRQAGSDTYYPPLGKQDYSVLLQAQYPLGPTKAQADLGQARAGLEEVGKALELAQRDLTLALWQTRQTLQSLQTITANNQTLVQMAREKHELNLKNYRIGRLDTFLLLDSVNALITAQLQEVQSAIRFKRLLVAYLALTDNLLPRHPFLTDQLHAAQEEK